jgi:hypothetical protein
MYPFIFGAFKRIMTNNNYCFLNTSRIIITFLVVISFASQVASETINHAIDSEFKIEFSLFDDHNDKNEKNDKKEKDDLELQDPLSNPDTLKFNKNNSTRKILGLTPSCIEISYSITSPPPDIN